MATNYNNGKDKDKDKGLGTNSRDLVRCDSANSNTSFQTINPPYLLLLGEAGSLCCAKLGFFDTFDDTFNNNFKFEGNAFDIIVFQSADGRLFQNSEFLVTFDGKRPDDFATDVAGGGSCRKTVLEIRRGESTVWFPIDRLKNNRSSSDSWVDEAASIRNNNKYNKSSPWSGSGSEDFTSSPCICCRPIHQRVSPFPPGMTMDESSALQSGGDECEISGRLAEFLLPGRNPIRYLLVQDDKIIGVARANIYLWSYQDRIVISDIDGTITKSNARGVVDTLLTEKFQYCHNGVCQLLTRLSDRPCIQIAYLTSRPIALASATRRFLENMTQQNTQGSNQLLPPGPLLGFGGTFSELLKMELYSKTTHHFKSGVLRSQIVKPFRHACAAAEVEESTNSESSSSSVFVAGFGNSWMDVQAYHMSGIELNKIFLINKKSHICVFNKKRSFQEKMVQNDDKENESSPLTTVDIPMSREWYQTQVGTMFQQGYADVGLTSHVWDEDHESSR
jgi:hypothetical protein